MTNATIPISLAPRISVETTQNIPRIIHQTFKTAEVTEGIFGTIGTWIDKNPEYTYEFYDDARMIDFIRNFDCTGFSFSNKQLNAAFDLIKPGAGKADIFRYCVLYVYGGIYSDIDTECLVPLKDIIQEEDDIVIIINSWCKTSIHHTCSQWSMIYDKHNPIIKHTLELVIKSVSTRVPVDYFGTTFGELPRFTGAAVYNKIFFDAMKIKINRIKNFSDLPEKVLSVNMFGYRYNIRFIHYGKNHYENPTYEMNCIPKFIRFKYKNYYNDLKKLGVSHWGETYHNPF
jgi:hypothetical protein